MNRCFLRKSIRHSPYIQRKDKVSLVCGLGFIRVYYVVDPKLGAISLRISVIENAIPVSLIVCKGMIWCRQYATLLAKYSALATVWLEVVFSGVSIAEDRPAHVGKETTPGNKFPYKYGNHTGSIGSGIKNVLQLQLGYTGAMSLHIALTWSISGLHDGSRPILDSSVLIYDPWMDSSL